MTNKEFINEFDILYNNITSNQAPGLDNYEKSVFLTLSQEQLITSYYSGRNPSGESFEETEEFRRYLSTLIRTYSTNNSVGGGLSENSKVIGLPSDLWFITYEQVKFASESNACYNNKVAQVVPITQDNLYQTLENPFKGPNLRRVLRLDREENKVEIISKYPFANYTVRYLRRPNPIILENLDGDLSINSSNIKTECELPTSLHRTILELAVKLASAAYKANEQQQ